MSSTAYTHSICSPRYMAVMPTTYTHSICSPRYMVVISTVYHPHYMYPQHITRHPHYMCYPHHMHMVWVTLTLFSTAYDPRHKLLSTAYTHSIYTPDIPWVYDVGKTCICCGYHMLWVHMSCADEAVEKRTRRSKKAMFHLPLRRLAKSLRRKNFRKVWAPICGPSK